MEWWQILLIVLGCIFGVLVIISWVHDMGVMMKPYELEREIRVREARRRLKELDDEDHASG